MVRRGLPDGRCWERWLSRRRRGHRSDCRGERNVAANQEMKLPELATSGAVEGLFPGGIRIKSDAGQTWLLQMQPTTKVLLTGTAKVDFLMPGQCISFTAEVDARRAKLKARSGSWRSSRPTPGKKWGRCPTRASARAGQGAKAGDAEPGGRR